jgi:hypothetical protein
LYITPETLYGEVKVTLVPVFPFDGFGVPVAEVTAEVPRGLVVVQDSKDVQLLALSAIVQVLDAGVRVPDITVTVADTVGLVPPVLVQFML